jgi:hypothetical protein
MLVDVPAPPWSASTMTVLVELAAIISSQACAIARDGRPPSQIAELVIRARARQLDRAVGAQQPGAPAGR